MEDLFTILTVILFFVIVIVQVLLKRKRQGSDRGKPVQQVKPEILSWPKLPAKQRTVHKETTGERTGIGEIGPSESELSTQLKHRISSKVLKDKKVQKDKKVDTAVQVKESVWQKIDRLPRMKKAVILSEILGKPVSLKR
jgi:hypothetical protein